MKTSRSKIAAAVCSAGLLGAVAFFATFQTDAQAQQTKAKAKAGAVTPGGLFNGYISGTVTGEKGPEAGVWVIAETKDLLTNFIKIVVTDDQGRFVIPDLPKANYDVWARGYGLIDSDKQKVEPGKLISIAAKTAPDEKSAAHYYPAIYWYSMMKIPEASVFGSKDAPSNVKLTDYLNVMKNNGCVGCGLCGEVADAAVLCPSFHKIEIVSHPTAWERWVYRFNQWAIGWLQGRA